MQNLLDLGQVIDMDRVADIKEDSFDLFTKWLDQPNTFFDILLIVGPLKLDIYGKEALFVDELPDNSWIVDDVSLRPIFEVELHKEIIKL